MSRVAYFVVPYSERRYKRGSRKVASRWLPIDDFSPEIQADLGEWAESQIAGNQAVVKVRVETADILTRIRARGWQERTRAQAASLIENNPPLSGHRYDEQNDVIVLEGPARPARTLDSLDKSAPSVRPMRGADVGDFPAVAVLENFTGSGDLAGRSFTPGPGAWRTSPHSGLFDGDNGGTITANKGHSITGWGGGVSAGTFDRTDGSSDGVEVFATLSVHSNLARLWWGATAGGSPTGYHLDHSSGTFKIREVVGASEVQIGATVASTVNGGDKIGLWHDNDAGGTMHVFTDTGSGWGEVAGFGAADNTYDVGVIGFEQNDGGSSDFDDFGGGLHAAAGGAQSLAAAAGITQVEAFGQATMTPAPLTLAAAAGIAENEAFGLAVLGPVNELVAAAGIGSEEGFGTATLSTIIDLIAAAGIGSQESFSPALIQLATEPQALAQAVGIAAQEQFGLGFIEPAALTLTQVAGISANEAFGLAVLSYVLVQAAGIGPQESFGVATIAPAAVTLTQAAGIGSNEAFGATIISAAGVQFTPHQGTFKSFDPTTYRAGMEVRFVAEIDTSDILIPCIARLWDITDGDEVPDSRVATTSLSLTEVKSPPLTLDAANHEYRGEFGGPVGATFECQVTDLAPTL